MFILPEVLINLFLDSLLNVFLFIAWIAGIRIALFFDINSDTPLQYSLIRQSYLASTILKFALSFKIFLLFYLIYTLDKLSNLIPGAMCAAGVVSSNEYGVWLMAIKILNIYLFASWLALNSFDMRRKDYGFTKKKFAFFVVIFPFVAAAWALEFLFFNGLDVSKIVSCCGVLFSPLSNSSLSSILRIDPKIAALIFYTTFVAIVLSFRRIYLFAFLHVVFVLVGLLSIIVFFSPYIYELPTHRCPFCLLQKEYYYVGYLIYALLFLGSFYAIKAAIAKALGESVSVKFALAFDIVLVMVLSYYPLIYYYKNGIWLL